MNDSESIALLKEIRDLQRRQIELAQQTLENQATALANQRSVIDKQKDNREILLKSRRWTQILLGLLLLGVFIYLIQPLLFLWFVRSR